MTRVSSRLFCVAMSLVLIHAVIASQAQEKALAALEQPCTFAIKDKPLFVALVYLQDFSNVKFYHEDRPVFRTRITFEAKGEKMRHALDSMLKPHKFGFEAKEDGIHIIDRKDP